MINEIQLLKSMDTIRNNREQNWDFLEKIKKDCKASKGNNVFVENYLWKIKKFLDIDEKNNLKIIFEPSDIEDIDSTIIFDDRDMWEKNQNEYIIKYNSIAGTCAMEFDFKHKSLLTIKNMIKIFSEILYKNDFHRILNNYYHMKKIETISGICLFDIKNYMCSPTKTETICKIHFLDEFLQKMEKTNLKIDSIEQLIVYFDNWTTNQNNFDKELQDIEQFKY